MFIYIYFPVSSIVLWILVGITCATTSYNYYLFEQKFADGNCVMHSHLVFQIKNVTLQDTRMMDKNSVNKQPEDPLGLQLLTVFLSIMNLRNEEENARRLYFDENRNC